MRSTREITDMMDKAAHITETIGTDVPSMTYEEGVECALRWAAGLSDDEPIETEIEEDVE